MAMPVPNPLMTMAAMSWLSVWAVAPTICLFVSGVSLSRDPNDCAYVGDNQQALSKEEHISPAKDV